MKRAILLGVSKDTTAVLFDVFAEVYSFEGFDVYPNIPLEIIPSLPIKIIDYKIMPLNAVINSSEEVFFGVATPGNKRSVFNYFLNNQNINSQRYRTVIHNTCYISQAAKIDNGVFVGPKVVVAAQSYVGFGVFIKRGSTIGHHNVIGAFTDINPGVTLSGKVTIGESCIIGSGSTIIDNVSIGANTVIGAGSVVVRDIPANSIAYGNPCIVIRENIRIQN